LWRHRRDYSRKPFKEGFYYIVPDLPSPWISVAELAPTWSDADEFGDIFGGWADTRAAARIPWDSSSITHWMPIPRLPAAEIRDPDEFAAELLTLLEGESGKRPEAIDLIREWLKGRREGS